MKGNKYSELERYRSTIACMAASHCTVIRGNPGICEVYVNENPLISVFLMFAKSVKLDEATECHLSVVSSIKTTFLFVFFLFFDENT